MASRTRMILFASSVLALLGAAAMAPIAGAQDPNEAKAREAELARRIETMKFLERQADMLKVDRAKRIERNRMLRDEIIANCELSPENVTPVLLGLERDAFKLQTELPPKSRRLQLVKDMLKKAETKDANDPTGNAVYKSRLLQQVEDITLELAESEFRFQLTQEKIKSLRKVQNLVDEYLLAPAQDLPRIEKAIDSAETQLMRLKMER